MCIAPAPCRIPCSYRRVRMAHRSPRRCSVTSSCSHSRSRASPPVRSLRSTTPTSAAAAESSPTDTSRHYFSSSLPPVADGSVSGSVNPSWGYSMTREQAIGLLSRLAEAHDGVFRGRDAVACGVSRNQLGMLVQADVLERVFPDTYRVTAVRKTNRQALRAALLWAGSRAAAAGCSAAELYELEGVAAP